MKKLLSILVCATILLSVFSFASLPASAITADDILSIDLIQNHQIIADEVYVDMETQYVGLTSECIINAFDYEVSYSDATSETLSYEQLVEKGIEINGIRYLGKLYELEDEYLLDTGNQPVEVIYMGNKVSSCDILVFSFVDFCSDLDPTSEYDDMEISYDEYGESSTLYWLLLPDESDNFELYSTDWDDIDAYITIFDENNAVVPYTDGWVLTGGDYYCLRVSYEFEEDCYDDVVFWLESNRDHTHSSTKTGSKKATLSANGYINYLCSSCGCAYSYTIYRPKTFTLSTSSYTYNGKVKTPTIKIKDAAGNTLKKNTDYTVKYASGRKNVGTYKVTITMKGNYSGTKTVTFKINPPKTTVKKVTGASKSLKVSITKKTTQVTGYQIQYSTSKNFSGAKTKTITSAKTTSATIKSLKAKKTYYVRVRTYKTVGKTKYYSGWSAAKSAKTK